jgi:hypothetical protein
MNQTATLKGVLCFFLSLLFLINSTKAQIIINEISSRNATIYKEGNKDYEDFIEIYNTSGSTINLENFYLSNVKATPTKWKFFPQFLNAGAYTIVFADEDNVFNYNYTFQHTNFKVAMGGETIYLSNAAGVIIDSLVSGKNLDINQSVGKLLGSTVGQVFYNQTTPNAPNTTTAYTAKAGSPTISKVGARYALGAPAVSVTATCPVGQTAIYTTDSHTPTEGINTPIMGNITFDTTTVFKARCIGNTPTMMPGIVKTETFFFNENTTLPIMSLTTDSNNLWNYNTGILVDGPNVGQWHGANWFQEWRRAAKVEYFDAAGVKRFTKDVAINTDGNSSIAAPKKSLRVNFNHTTLGDSKLNFEMFPNTRPGLTSFKNVKLRGGGNQYTDPTYGGGVVYHEGAVETFARKLNVSFASYKPTVLYLNGKYWGLYEMRERLDESLYKNTLGASEDSIYTFDKQGWSSYPEELIYTGVTDQIFNNSIKNSESFYNYFDSKFDIKNFMDYFITEIHFQNNDWIGYYFYVNNLVIWKDYSSTGDKKYRFSLKDFDGAFCSSYDQNTLNVVLTTPNPHPLPNTFKSAMQNDKLKKDFINRYADVVNYYFHKDTILNAINNFQAETVGEIADECNRWPMLNTTAKWDYRYQVMKTCMNTRNVTGLNQVDAEFLGNAGKADITLVSQPTVGGKIQFSTITPTLPWTGTYFKGNEIPFTAIPNIGYEFVGWVTNNGSIRAADLNTISLDTSFASNTILTAVFTPLNILNNKLLSFTVKAIDCNVTCNWTLDTDEEMEHYEIQRKTAFDVDFVSVNKTFSKKSLLEINYTTTTNAIGNNNQYRLKMINDQGKVSYSNIVIAQTNCTNFNVQLQTNPVAENLILNINNVGTNQICNISIYNAMGQLVSTQKQTLTGNGIIKIPVANLGAAIYAVSVSVGNENSVLKFLKK